MPILDDEIRRIVEYQNTIKRVGDRKSQLEVDSLITETLNKIENRNYDFSLFNDMILRQNSKRRLVKSFNDWSSEEVICIYLKRCLDRVFHIKYPNRNNFIHTLFDVLSAVKNMGDFSIVKFDFKDFFNSISSVYVFHKYISNSKLERFQKEIFRDFVIKNQYCYAGYNTSNVLAEIVSTDFDNKIKQRFFHKGLIYFRRYIDDGILIFNQLIAEDECKAEINEIIAEVFYDSQIDCIPKCKTKLNNKKFIHITKRKLDMIPDAAAIQHLEFDFLGYLFRLNKDGDMEFGITQQKIEKYSKQIEKIVDEYNENEDIELLRHRLGAFSTRIVYRVNRYKTKIWKAKGFNSNYNELRFHNDNLIDETKSFLINAYINVFVSKGIDIPYFLKGPSNDSKYSIYNNLIKNKALLFEERIGINKDTVSKMCERIGILLDNDKSYDSYVREYLIKVKVGH